MRLAVLISALLLGACATLAPAKPTGVIALELNPQTTRSFDATRRAETLSRSTEVVRRRVDAAGHADASVDLANGRITVRVPGLGNGAELDEFGRTLSRPGMLTFNLVDTEANPADYPEEHNGRRMLPDDSRNAAPTVIVEEPIIDVADIASASRQPDIFSGQPGIAFTLTETGARRFERATEQYVGRLFAIVLDDRIVSSPRIQTPIRDGKGVITGPFTAQEAEAMAIILRAGALPATLDIVEKRMEAPTK